MLVLAKMRSCTPFKIFIAKTQPWFCDILCKFIAECRQKNGTPYSPKTILQLSNSLQSHAVQQNPNACRSMESKDPRYKSFHNVLNNLSMKLLSEAVKKQAKIINESEEQILWQKGVVGTHSPNSLLNAVFFYCGMYLCLRGGEEHRDLKFSQLEFKLVPDPTDVKKTIRCLIYTEHGSKNRKGMVHQVHLQNKIVPHYEDRSRGVRCFVHLVELYVSKLPDKAK